MDRMCALFRHRQDSGEGRSSSRLSPSLTLFVSVMLFCSADKGLAGYDVWTSNGPEGGFVFALGIDPSNPVTVFVGTWGGGVYSITFPSDPFDIAVEGLNADCDANPPFDCTTLTAGLASGATDGLDIALGEREMAPHRRHPTSSMPGSSFPASKVCCSICATRPPRVPSGRSRLELDLVDTPST